MKYVIIFAAIVIIVILILFYYNTSTKATSTLSCGTCASGETCNTSTGQCQCGTAASCTKGLTCVNGICSSVCGSTTCSSDQACSNGQCVQQCTANSCSTGETCNTSSGLCQCGTNSACTNAQTCVNGTCVANCGSAPCSSSQACNNEKQCVTRCTSTSCGLSGTCNTSSGLCECGAAGSDPCSSSEYCSTGGNCLASCSSTSCSANETCNTATGQCQCGTNSCTDEQYCYHSSVGALSCVNKCPDNNTCSNHETCDSSTGACYCISAADGACPISQGCAIVDSSGTVGCAALCGDTACDYGYVCNESTKTCEAGCETNTGGNPCPKNTICTYLGCAPTLCNGSACPAGQACTSTNSTDCADINTFCYGNCQNDPDYKCVNGICLSQECQNAANKGTCGEGEACTTVSGSATCVPLSEYCFPLCESDTYTCVNGTCSPNARNCPPGGCNADQKCYNGGCISLSASCTDTPGVCDNGQYCSNGTCVTLTKCTSQEQCTNGVCVDGFCREKCTFGSSTNNPFLTCAEPGSICVSAKQYTLDTTLANTDGFCAMPYNGSNMYFEAIGNNGTCYSDNDCATNHKCNIESYQCYNPNTDPNAADYNSALDPANYTYTWVNLNIDPNVACGSTQYTYDDTVPISCINIGNGLVPSNAPLLINPNSGFWDYRNQTQYENLVSVVFELGDDPNSQNKCTLKNISIPGMYSPSTQFFSFVFDGDTSGAMGSANRKVWNTWAPAGAAGAPDSKFNCVVKSASYLTSKNDKDFILYGSKGSPPAPIPNSNPLLWKNGTNLYWCTSEQGFLCANPVDDINGYANLMAENGGFLGDGTYSINGLYANSGYSTSTHVDVSQI